MLKVPNNGRENSQRKEKLKPSCKMPAIYDPLFSWKFSKYAEKPTAAMSAENTPYYKPYSKKWCVWVLFKGIYFEIFGKCWWVLIRAYADSLRFSKFSPVSMQRTVEGLLQESVPTLLEGAGRVARKEGRFDQCFTHHSHPPLTLQQKIMMHMCQLCLGTRMARESTASDSEETQNSHGSLPFRKSFNC